MHKPPQPVLKRKPLDTSAALRQNTNAMSWPQFRGSGGSGVGISPALPTEWSATKNVLWKSSLPGRSWSSPIAFGERLYVTCVIREGESEKPRKGLYFGGERPAVPTDRHLFKLLCIHLNTGKLLWETTLHAGAPKTSIHLKNSYGAETPCTDGQRIYCTFGGLGVFAVSMDGKKLWSRELDPAKTRYGWGYASSPVVHDGRVYMVNDNDDRADFIALDARTGKDIFRIPRDEKSNWATPFVWIQGGRTEIVTCGTNAVRSYDTNGKVMWQLRGMSTIVIPTPLTGSGLLFVTSGYVGDAFRPLYAIRPGASGDITLEGGTSSNKSIAWSYPAAGPYNPSPLYYDGRLYVLYDRGLISCYDAATGKVIYDKQRLPEGFAFTTSPWAAAGHVFCLNEDGVCYVIKAGDKFELVRQNRLTENDMCMASPALVGNKLVIRTSEGLYCIANSR